MFLRPLLQKRNYSINRISTNIKNIKVLTDDEYDICHNILETKKTDTVSTKLLIDELKQLDNISEEEYKELKKLLDNKRDVSSEGKIIGYLSITFTIIFLGGLFNS